MGVADGDEAIVRVWGNMKLFFFRFCLFRAGLCGWEAVFLIVFISAARARVVVGVGTCSLGF